VFLREDGRLGRDVAIKSVRLDKAADPDVRRRFACEGRAAARLSHNVVGVYDVGEGRTSPYLVTAR
jgi:serine/threonine-protein kinase